MSTSGLPNDVLLDIHSRFPVKSLLRFIGLCKPWRTHIEDPTFIALHHKRMENNHETLLIQSRDDASADQFFSFFHTKNPDLVVNLDCPFPPFGLRGNLDIVGSINGVVCLSSPPHSPFIVLWNPATKQFRYLPRPRIANFPTDRIDKISIGFAFDSFRCDYKVIRIVCFKTEEEIPTRVEVFSVNSGGWREIKVVLLPFYFLESKCVTVVKGVPYWAVCPENQSDDRGFFLRFDAVNSVFGQLPAPEIASHHTISGCIVNYKDSFAALSYSADGVDLWMMEDSSGSWSKKFNFGPILGVERLLGCSKNGEIVAENAEGKLILYCPDSQEVKEVQIDGVRVLSFLVFGYSESLVLFKKSMQVGKSNKFFSEQSAKQGKRKMCLRNF